MVLTLGHQNHEGGFLGFLMCQGPSMGVGWLGCQCVCRIATDRKSEIESWGLHTMQELPKTAHQGGCYTLLLCLLTLTLETLLRLGAPARKPLQLPPGNCYFISKEREPHPSLKYV